MEDSNDLQSKCDRYRSFYEQDPDNYDILCQLVDLETQLGAFDDARAHLESALIKWSNEPALEFRKATIELAVGNADIASDILQRLLDAGVDHPAIRYNLGYACLSIKDPKRAKEMFDSIEGLEVELPDVPLMQSRTLHYLGDLDGAIEKANHYFARYPDSEEVLGVLGLLYLDRGETAEAKRYAQKAYEVNPENREALITLGSVALDELEPEKAEDYFTQATRKYPQSGRAWSGIGLTHMMIHDIDRAQIELEKAVQFMSEHLGTWHALAWCQIVKGDLEAAENTLNSANEVDHNFGETHGGLAVIAALRGDWDAAEKMAKVALRLDPESFAARFAKSLSLRRHDPHAAQALIDEMLSSTPDRSGQSLQAMVSNIFNKRRAAKK